MKSGRFDRRRGARGAQTASVSLDPLFVLLVATVGGVLCILAPRRDLPVHRQCLYRRQRRARGLAGLRPRSSASMSRTTIRWRPAIPCSTSIPRFTTRHSATRAPNSTRRRLLPARRATLSRPRPPSWRRSARRSKLRLPQYRKAKDAQKEVSPATSEITTALKSWHDAWAASTRRKRISPRPRTTS